jgi:hypothetical protein
LNPKLHNENSPHPKKHNPFTPKPSIPKIKFIVSENAKNIDNDIFIELVEELDFETKRQIIRTVVKKIVATKKEVNVWGYLPILETGKIGYELKHRYRGAAKCWQVYPI